MRPLAWCSRPRSSAASPKGAHIATRPEALPRPAATSSPGGGIAIGLASAYLSLIVILPLAALVWQAGKAGRGGFWNAITDPQAVAALKLTLFVSVAVCLVNAVMGTIVAWILVRDRFRGQSVINAIIDLPFALPTIVAGLTLLALYGPNGPVGVNVAFSRAAVLLALLFVTLPFVIRTVQPVLLELDREMEEAATSLGAGPLTTFRYIVFPNLFPAILSGVALAFARAIGEFGSVVLISGNLPFKTEVASVFIFGRIESGDPAGAAAVSVLILVITFAVLLGIGAVRRWTTRHDRA